MHALAAILKKRQLVKTIFMHALAAILKKRQLVNNASYLLTKKR